MAADESHETRGEPDASTTGADGGKKVASFLVQLLLIVRDESALDALLAGGQIALKYVADDGAQVSYPANPNGSVSHIAGLCNPAGNVMGMMPHPEDHIYKTQHPHTHRGYEGGLGLALFKSGVQYAASI